MNPNILLNSMPWVHFFFDPINNIFRDVTGHRVDTYPLISANRLFLFKHNKSTMTFVNFKHKTIVVIVYPTELEAGMVWIWDDPPWPMKGEIL